MPIAEQKRSSRGDRFDARISPEKKSKWQRAADIRGCKNLTEFVTTSADALAEQTIREAEFRDFTLRDRIAFVEALLKPAAPPNAKLREAAALHAKTFSAS